MSSFYRVFSCVLVFVVFACKGLPAQNIGGIGVMLGIDSSEGSRMPVIRQVLPNSPASANLKEGMFIIAVDGTGCRDLTIEDVVKKIRGADGSLVKVSVSDNKKGKNAVEYTLSRVAIAQAVTDTVSAFYGACEQNNKQLKRNGHRIVKAFRSECGDFYYNFNADTGLYHIRMQVLEAGGRAKGGSVSADVFETDNDNQKTRLTEGDAAQWKGWPVAETNADVRFSRPRVGSISIRLSEENVCRAVFITVYQ